MHSVAFFNHTSGYLGQILKRVSQIAVDNKLYTLSQAINNYT